MKKVEQLFYGEKIIVDNKEEENCLNQIFDELQIENPSTVKNKNQSHENQSSFCNIISKRNQVFTINRKSVKSGTFSLQIATKYLDSFLKENVPKTFSILTKNNEYECNIIGINSSKVIHDILDKNPNSSQYVYDFDDEFNEFQLVCDIFNFKNVWISIDNIDSLKMICEELKIDVVMSDINKYVDTYEKSVQNVDDQQLIIDQVDELFETLYKIKEITVNSAKKKIMVSDWIKTEDKVHEMVAVIFQVIRTDFILQPYLADLIELLDKEADKSNKLEVLVPFIVDKLLVFLSSLVEQSIASFTFIMYKKKFIEKVDILRVLGQKCFSLNNMKHSFFHDAYFIFLPELYELLGNKTKSLFSNGLANSVNFYLSNIEKFTEMRDKGEPEDQIIRSLRYDDVDTLQTIISTSKVNIDNDLIPFNIFDEYAQKTSFINYAAAYGSVKCFKYLLLNHASLNEKSFRFAVFGGNTEIIKIVDQQSSTIIDKRKSYYKAFCNADEINNVISAAIMKHQNDLFDWILEQKCPNFIENKDLIVNILDSATRNGNIHPIINIVDKGFDFLSLKDDVIHPFISNASSNGFYTLLQFICIVMKKKLEKLGNKNVFGTKSSVIFGNLSILKFFIQHIQLIDYKQALILSVKNNYQ